MPWYQRWRNVFRSDELNDQLDDELRFHLAETVDRLVDQGMSERDAIREARLRLGNYAAQKEKTRDMNVAAFLDSTRADVMYGLRQIRLNPGFASVAILSLALGIGANTAIFQLVNAIRLKTLPVRSPEELVSIDFEKGATRFGAWYGPNVTMTYAQWQQIQSQSEGFSGVAAWSADRFDLTNGGEIRLAQGLYVSGDFFRVLDVGALLGRTFTPQDDSQSCSVGAVLSYSFWQREFGGSTSVLSRTVSLDGRTVPVIGVTPSSFFGVEVGNRYDVAVPICADRVLAQDHQGREAMPAAWWLSAMGRLRPGWTVSRAAALLRARSPGIMRATLPPSYRPDAAKSFLQNKLTATEAGTGISQLRQQFERPLWMLMATTGLVLLIACANLANLLLARGTVREREIAVRLAVGASRRRLVRQLLVESLVLAIIGAALGTALSLALSRSLVAFITTSDNMLFVDLAIDWRMLGFTAALGILTCLLFGLLPALRATYLSPVSAARAGGRSFTAGKAHFGLRRTLVAGQVALSLVLLFGALLFVRSLHNLMTVDAGFKPDGIISATINLGTTKYTTGQKLAMMRLILEKLSSMRGVSSVAQVSVTPVSGGTWNNLTAPDSMPAATGKLTYFNQIGPGYFKTMGTTLLAGRDFSDRDTPSSPKAAIVNQTFARRFFGAANPVGHTFHMAADAGKAEPVFEITGLVQDTKYGALREDFLPIAYFPFVQDETIGNMATFVTRTTAAPSQFMNDAKKITAEVNSSFGIEFKLLSTQLEDSLLRERLMAALSGGFGFLAALLATMGLYGVIAYMVAQRRNEIGIRMALGAARGSVLGLILREAGLLLSIGLTGGLVLAFWAGRAASSMLFGLRPHDPVSLVTATAALSIIALIASYLPARRAAALNPMVALRDQ